MVKIYKEINVRKSISHLKTGETISFPVNSVKYMAVVRALQTVCGEYSYAKYFSIDNTTDDKLITVIKK